MKALPYRGFDGRELPCDFRAPEDGAPTLVLVHGLGQRLPRGVDLFKGVPRPWGLAFPERRGHGGPPYPEPEAVLDENARDALALTARLGGPLVLAGHSLGAAVVLRALELASGKELAPVASIVLLNPPGPDPLGSMGLMGAWARLGLSAQARLRRRSKEPGLLSRPLRAADRGLTALMTFSIFPELYLQGEMTTWSKIELLRAESTAAARFSPPPVDRARLEGRRLFLFSGAHDRLARPAMTARAAALLGLSPSDKRDLARLEPSDASAQWWDDPDGNHVSYLREPDRFLRVLRAHDRLDGPRFAPAPK